jgi:proline iminopeptidase/L-proline amide hydrolase
MLMALLVAPYSARSETPSSPYPAPTMELRVPVDGGRIYVRVNGNLKGPKPPVLFIHGGPGSTFDNFLEALPLAQDRAVILYDQLDSGYSDRPNDPRNWRVERFVGEIEAIRKALGIERWHIAGSSWGGTLALEYGALRLASTASVTIMNPLVSTQSWIADANALRAEMPVEIQATLTACEGAKPPPQDSCDKATDAFYSQYLRRTPRSERALAQAKLRGTQGFGDVIYLGMWGPSEFRATGLLKTYDGEHLLARLDGQRTLFMTGQYDEARPQTVAGFAARVPGADFGVIPGSAHALFADRPAETLAILQAFIERHDAP